MFKQSHKRPSSDRDGARGLRGIPSHEFGFLRAQVPPAWVLRSASAQAECLCASRNTGVGPGLVTDVDGLGNVTECEG